jgi:flagellar transcriptional activator FlhD
MDRRKTNSYIRTRLNPAKKTEGCSYLISPEGVTLQPIGDVRSLNIWGAMMTTNDMMAEIRDANLSYLMLAQQMIRSDRPTAIFRLGISADIADLLEKLSNPQLLKLAYSNMMLARFRFDDNAILGMLTDYDKDRTLARSHAAILMAGQPVEAMN